MMTRSFAYFQAFVMLVLYTAMLMMEGIQIFEIGIYLTHSLPKAIIAFALFTATGVTPILCGILWRRTFKCENALTALFYAMLLIVAVYGSYRCISYEEKHTTQEQAGTGKEAHLLVQRSLVPFAALSDQPLRFTCAFVFLMLMSAISHVLLHNALDVLENDNSPDTRSPRPPPQDSGKKVVGDDVAAATNTSLDKLETLAQQIRSQEFQEGMRALAEAMRKLEEQSRPTEEPGANQPGV